MQDHITNLQEQHNQRVQRALDNEAKLRDINKEEYQVDLNRMAFVKIESDE